MWDKELRDDLRKNYEYLKAGRKNKPNSVLLARMHRPNYVSGWMLVIRCSEEGSNYIFDNNCPFCGKETHYHGSAPGVRTAHCTGGKYDLLEKLFGHDAINSYFVANHEEYDTIWNWAKRVGE